MSDSTGNKNSTSNINKNQSVVPTNSDRQGNTLTRNNNSKSKSNLISSESNELIKSQEKVMTSLIHLNEDILPNDSNWEKVTYKNKKSRQLVVGTGTDGIAGTIKGVPKFVDLHVYRIDPATDVTDMENLLKPHFPEVHCESMKSRYPGVYASFKVRIYQDNFRKAMNPTVWPKNACVNTFLHLRTHSQLQR